MKPNIVILTNEFPGSDSKSEDWLNDEIMTTFGFYNKILIVPGKTSKQYKQLPENCEVIELSKDTGTKLNSTELFNCLKILFSDFKAYPNKQDFFKAFRYNLALLKNLHLKAKKISGLNQYLNKNTILYAYWADNLATMACMLNQMYGPFKVVTRAHGFEIFEEQTKHNVIPFRTYQLKHITKLFADSKRGMDYLHAKHPDKKQVNTCSYVGTKNRGLSVFNPDNKFSIVTCSHVRGVKRLELMAGILKHINFELVWHLIGDGEGIDTVKKANAGLNNNISVVYHGYMKNEEALQFYKDHSLNLFVSLSFSEGLPVSMMEALSFGIPLMSTDVGGCNEICNDNTGFLIEKDFNPEEVAKKLSEFKHSAKNTENFRKQCRLFWKNNFEAEKNYSGFAETITQL